jgi:Na+(H+)/acetate symporter ActP
MKMFAISVPVFVLLAVYGGYGKNLSMNKTAAEASPPAIVQTVGDAEVQRKPMPEKAPADEKWIAPFGPLTSKAAKTAGLSDEQSRPYSLLYTFSLIVALVCGTAGLPHILVRFYTNPDGVAAKRTTMWVMILIGVFYVFPPIFGVLGRNFLPELYAGSGSKGPDKIVLELPILIREKYGILGSILSGITCAGAFAAFMSTFSGLLVSMTSALAHDVYGRMLRPQSTPAQRMRMFKWCSVLVGGVAVLLGAMVEPLEINFMVGQAFAIAAASYFPLLFMSVWWRGMTMQGAATGMLTGGLCALVSAALTNASNLALDKGPMGKLFAGFSGLNDFWKAHPLLRILAEQPAIWAVPLAIGLMIVVSKATKKSVPPDVRMKMLVLHAPEALGLKQEYIQEQQGMGH